MGSGAIDGSRVSSEEIGYIPYAEVVVRTIKKESRGFVRARNAARLRRREDAGRSEDMADSCAEASGGITGSALLPDSCLRRFLRLWGSSCVDGSAIDSDILEADGMGVVFEVAELAPDNVAKTPSLLREPSAA